MVLLGDWGTGLEDSADMLAALERGPVAAVIHLGDIYYAGTPEETRFNFEVMLHRAMDEVLGPGRRIPVFTIPGNHDYYSGGAGFYGLIDRLNEPEYRQTTSYFSLRTNDGRWQFIGLDTGFNDRGLPSLPQIKRAPALHDSEIRWARQHISTFAGRTILLTHHQLFSAGQVLNGAVTGSRPNVNESLKAMVDGIEDKIACWFWGHEHCLIIYKNYQEGIARSLLVGCSAFEVAKSQDPYAVNFADVKALADVRLGTTRGWYNHGAATITFPEGLVEYFQFPSWIRSAGTVHTLERFTFAETLD